MQKNKKAVCAVIGAISFGFILILVFFMNSNIRLSRDDFFYYPFARNGLMQFISGLKDHYLLINGRLFVHSICAIFLTGNLWIYRIFNIASIVLSLYLCCRLVSKENEKRMYLFFIAFSMFWLLGNSVITESALWISGSFNYVFPMLLLFTYTCFLMNNTSKTGEILCLILGFLSSVTTEISSLITIIITITFLINRYKSVSKIPIWYKVTVLIQFIGFMFLILSPGMHGRFDESGNAGIQQLIYRTLINFNTFIQMSFEKNGVGLSLCFALLFSGICAYKTLKNKPLAVLMLIFAVFPILTINGIIYFTWSYILLAAACSALLFWYSIQLFKSKDRITMFVLICFIISYGVMSASGIVGYRMLFWPGICLLIIGLRAISLLDINRYLLCAICIISSAICSVNAIHLIAVNNENAAVWDTNQEIIESFQGGSKIELENVPDELFFQGAVPVDNNFGDHYLNTFGIPNEVESCSADKQYYVLSDEKNTMVTDKAVKRDGIYYVCYKPLFQYLNIEESWIYDTVEAKYNDKLYRFHYGAYTVMDNHFGGTGIKLKAPIRVIDSWLYISVDDANNIFNINLKVDKSAT